MYSIIPIKTISTTICAATLAARSLKPVARNTSWRKMLPRNRALQEIALVAKWFVGDNHLEMQFRIIRSCISFLRKNLSVSHLMLNYVTIIVTLYHNILFYVTFIAQQIFLCNNYCPPHWVAPSKNYPKFSWEFFAIFRLIAWQICKVFHAKREH